MTQRKSTASAADRAAARAVGSMRDNFSHATEPRRSKISPKQLTHLLSSADDAHHLLRAYSRHNASVAPIHVGAFWSRLGKLVRGADPDAAQFLDDQLAVFRGDVDLREQIRGDRLVTLLRPAQHLP